MASGASFRYAAHMAERVAERAAEQGRQLWAAFSHRGGGGGDDADAGRRGRGA